MPASPGGSLATRVHLDANALIDYIRERALHDTGRPPTGRRADALRKRLDQARHVLVAETAGVEAQRNLPKDLVRKMGRSEAREVMGHALELLHQYRGDVERSDHVEYVSAAREMYSTSGYRDPAPGERPAAACAQRLPTGVAGAARRLGTGSCSLDAFQVTSPRRVFGMRERAACPICPPRGLSGPPQPLPLPTLQAGGAGGSGTKRRTCSSCTGRSGGDPRRPSGSRRTAGSSSVAPPPS